MSTAYEPDDRWTWPGQCTCCGCRVTFEAKELPWLGKWQLSMWHQAEEKQWASVMVDDDELRDGGRTLTAAIEMVTERLYGSGLC